MEPKNIEFDGGNYRLEFSGTGSGKRRNFILYKDQLYSQKDILSKMLYKIMTKDDNHGIPEGIASYVANRIDNDEKSGDIYPYDLAKEVYGYLDRNQKERI
ncbi:MAG: hypothetical protein FWG66_01290 [Spirochaetes bacterium]|nr:hypothetical protein [Spirochaetota bacterium]